MKNQRPLRMWRRNVMASGGRVMAYLCTARTLRMRSRHNERRVLHSLDRSGIIIPSLLEKVNAINPSTDIFRRKRGLCIREANRVYSDCLTGRNGKPFDPYLFYEE